MTEPISASLSHDAIMVGRDFSLVVILEPIAGQTEAEVVTALGSGATVTALVVDTDAAATTIATATGAITSAADRKITITLTDTQTTGLTPGHYRWRVHVLTETGTGLLWPVDMPPAVVRAA